MVRINRLLEAMRAQSQPEGMRLEACGFTAVPELMSVTDEAYQPVTDAGQNEMMGADCWMRLQGMIIRKGQQRWCVDSLQDRIDSETTKDGH